VTEHLERFPVVREPSASAHGLVNREAFTASALGEYVLHPSPTSAGRSHSDTTPETTPEPFESIPHSRDARVGLAVQGRAALGAERCNPEHDGENGRQFTGKSDALVDVRMGFFGKTYYQVELDPPHPVVAGQLSGADIVLLPCSSFDELPEPSTCAVERRGQGAIATFGKSPHQLVIQPIGT
jgi:hypothetical protein